MNNIVLSLTALCLLAGVSVGPRPQVANSPKPIYVFAYFKGNGEDGLHLASTPDGLTWTSLKNDQSFLKPTVGQDKLMRDPCITQGPDGTFHMVWTVSWKEKGTSPKKFTFRQVYATERLFPCRKRSLSSWSKGAVGRLRMMNGSF